MRYSLLDMTQIILASMESDEVSSIHETPESRDVASIIQQCYFDIIGRMSPPETEGLYKLDASTDSTKPVLMLVPDEVSRIIWLQYDHGEDTPNFTELTYCKPGAFLQIQQGLDPSDATVHQMVVEMNGKDFIFSYRDDRFPTYYTVLDEKYVVFDSYKASVENTLTESRSLIYGELIPSFEMDDFFVPDLDPRQFQLLLNEAKSLAFVEKKQAQHPIAERKARRNEISAQKHKYDMDPDWSGQHRARYGRRGRGWSSMKRAMRRGQ